MAESRTDLAVLILPLTAVEKAELVYAASRPNQQLSEAGMTLLRRALFQLDALKGEVDRLTSKLAEAEERFARAAAKTDGVDYRIGHYRDNATPDELRDIILGLADRLASKQP